MKTLMAYTLNGRQPVICTIVADQPYFYKDIESAEFAEKKKPDLRLI